MLNSIQYEGKLPAPRLKFFQKKEGICRRKNLLKAKTGTNELLVQTILMYFLSLSFFLEIK